MLHSVNESAAIVGETRGILKTGLVEPHLTNVAIESIRVNIGVVELQVNFVRFTPVQVGIPVGIRETKRGSVKWRRKAVCIDARYRASGEWGL